ncbi:IucA/IucC family protein [Streptomyces sp. NPDC000594]|uniref:IucA/IucC family protein n=1 Tax=Streptomyces sp. NPDC000594 TaxID=3154261 RepID=UPI00332EFE92
MNATPAPLGPAPAPAPVGAMGAPLASTGATLPTGGAPDDPRTVPRQHPGPRPADGADASPRTAPAARDTPPAGPDPLDDPDPHRAADAATVGNLLRCWAREHDLPEPGGATLRIPLPASGTALLVPVRSWSPTGTHRLDPPRLEGAGHRAPPVDAVTVAALLARETDTAHHTELVGRVADSVRRTADGLAHHRAHPAPPETDPFLAAEQALVLGHPLHPTPKSRPGLSDSEHPVYAPELHGSFPLHWMAVHRSVLATDSAWTERGRPLPAERLTARLAPGLPLPQDTVALPLHPWQAAEVRRRPAVAALLDAGLLRDLGPWGDRWHPTSSVRTVYRPGAPAMLKLSLALSLTNSRREHLRKELHRGVEVHRLLRTGLAERWRAAHPGFGVVRDPAWLAVDSSGSVDGVDRVAGVGSGSYGGTGAGAREPVPGLDVVLRHNPFGPDDDVVCVAGLTAPRPWPGRGTLRSRLAETVARLARRTGRPVGAVATEWFLRYLDQVVLPVLWLDATAGVALEAHQQNTLVRLDPDGWPAGGHYRDNQGYYFRASYRERLERRLPGIGSHSDTFVPDAVADERFAYYLGVNNVLGLIGALGAQRLADERVLLAGCRTFLASAAALGSPLPGLLLDCPTLRTKANLLTRLRGLDELTGPVETQSVYVTVANPLHR